jgi:hypothetical protein
MEDFLPVKSRLPELEKERGLEPYQVYEAIKMSKSQYSAYRNTVKILGIKNGKMLAEFFGIPIDDLYVWKRVPLIRRRFKSD